MAKGGAKVVAAKSHGHSKINKKIKQGSSSDAVRYGIAILVAVIAIVISFQWWKYSNLIRIKTPFRGPKMVESLNEISSDPERFWGSYRSHLYFGMRTRSPDSLLFGIMWFPQFTRDGQFRMRYGCDQGDKLAKYGWLKHDGRLFGTQEIVDDDYVLMTDFVKRPFGDHGGDWTARLTGKRRPGEKHDQFISIILATALSGNGFIEPIMEKDNLVGVKGNTVELGSFTMRFNVRSGKVMLKTYLTKHEDNVYKARDSAMKHLRYRSIKSNREKDMQLLGLEGQINNDNNKAANVMLSHIAFEFPFVVEISFESDSGTSQRKESLSGKVFTTELNDHTERFDQRFNDLMNLDKKSVSKKEIVVAKAALSNLIGGIGYFHGESIVTSVDHKEPTLYWPASLYTAVPSRSFFPRGFLWDEGFHQLIVARWDKTIAMDVLSHWLDLINVDGWIPREQILGYEAMQRVPAEFVVQHSENANPPTLFLTIDSIMSNEFKTNGVLSNETINFLKKAYPRLSTWYQWYNITQKGSLPFSYRWKGRDDKADRELNPKTLTSGLDDFPRASHPTTDERHIDLRCWMALASRVMANIADAVGDKDEKYANTYQDLVDNKLLNQLHWSEKLKQYADYGNHSKFVKLEKHQPHPDFPAKTVRVVKSKTGPQLKYVPSFGYVSLFPFLLNILDPSSSQLKQILTDLRKPELLWTDYGLRSLAKNDALYMKKNTEHDPPYWRGPIWINMNYLAVRSLHYYAKLEGANQELAADIYNELRGNLIKNIVKQYETTGYLWEQYNDKTGKGQGCFPFSGWTALVTLILGEIY